MTSSQCAAEYPLPMDVALKIVSSIELLDVCSLSSCSKHWQVVCASDFVWERFCRDRWPETVLDKEFLAYDSQKDEPDQQTDANYKGWRGFYVKKHAEMARKATVIAEFLEQQSSFESFDIRHHLKAIEDLHSMHFNFKDVQLFFFKPKLNVLLNLVGLHYCVKWLNVPAEYVTEAVSRCKIEEKRVCIQWRRFRGSIRLLMLQDRIRYVYVTLGDLAAGETGVLSLLQRGVFNQPAHIQIFAA